MCVCTHIYTQERGQKRHVFGDRLMSSGSNLGSNPSHSIVKAVASQVAQWVKNPPANAGCGGDAGLIPGSERSPGEKHGNPLQYSSLENPMDTGAWKAIVHRVAKSRTLLKQLSMQCPSDLKIGKQMTGGHQIIWLLRNQNKELWTLLPKLEYEFEKPPGRTEATIWNSEVVLLSLWNLGYKQPS